MLEEEDPNYLDQFQYQQSGKASKENERTIKRSLQGSAATRCVMGRVSRRSRRRLEGIGSVFFVDVHDGQAGELDDMHPHRVTRLTQCKER